MPNSSSLNSCSELMLRKQQYSNSNSKPMLMLKDYLLDDLSSCSSNGFRSFPRRQCCTTTVRFLLEIDLNKSKPAPPQKQRQRSTRKKHRELLRSKSAAASTATLSAMQRASEAVVNAVKQHLTFAATKKSKKTSILPRSFSRMFLWQSFRKRNEPYKEIKRLKSFGELIGETSAISPEHTTTTTVAVTTTESESNSSTSNSNSNSWTDSESTATSDNSEVNSGENDVVNKKKAGVTTSATVAKYSAETTKKEWRHEEEKVQFSPISVMDFPCDDNEDEVSSPFQEKQSHKEGSKRRSNHKVRRFGNNKLEPVDLVKRIALSKTNAMDEINSPCQPYLTSVDHEERVTKEKATTMLEQIKESLLSYNLSILKATENLLLDFFREKITEGGTCDYEDLDVAKEWMNGQPREMPLGWEVKRDREAYIRDMEKGVKWTKLDDDEKGNVAFDLEAKVFASLMDEILCDLFIS